MKSRYTIMSEAASDRCKQVCSACTNCQHTKSEEREISVNGTRQLYGTEAEDYFFYFIPGAFDAAFTQARN